MMARELGLSALFVCSGERDANMLYVSESITEILGYEPQDLVGKTCYLVFHPDETELIREVQYFATMHEKVGCIMYVRLLHQRGFYVDCAVTYNSVHDLTVGMVTRAINGPNVIRLAATAREVVEVRGGAEGMSMRRWSTERGSRSPTSSPMSPPDRKPWEKDWVRSPPSSRTFFLLDRFTDTARIMFASNDLLVNTGDCKDGVFYSFVRPQDRPKVRQWIDAAKTWAPIVFDEEHTGGHGYLIFDVIKGAVVARVRSRRASCSDSEGQGAEALVKRYWMRQIGGWANWMEGQTSWRVKVMEGEGLVMAEVPDLPLRGSHYPEGTEESVRAIEGQQIMSVEGIFTAYSDGIVCIIAPVGTTSVE